METLSYEKRIELGNLVPALGQFKVMEKIPQYQQCEVHNLVEAPAEVPESTADEPDAPAADDPPPDGMN